MPLRKPLPRYDAKVRAVFRRFPFDVADTSEKFFKASFKAEAWEGVPWPNRKIEPRVGARNKRGQRGLLIRSGTLRDSIQATEISARRVVVEAGYTVGSRSRWNLAQIHNEGLRPVPRRRFIGDSPALRRIIKKGLVSKLRTALK